MNKLYKNRYRTTSTRATWWSYGWSGAYFITICTRGRRHFFGEIINGKMNLSPIGEFARDLWYEIPDHAHNVELGAFQVMPNHIHGIIILNGTITNANSKTETGDTVKGSLVGTDDAAVDESFVGTDDAAVDGSFVGTDNVAVDGSFVGTNNAAVDGSFVGTNNVAVDGSFVGTNNVAMNGSLVGTNNVAVNGSLVVTDNVAVNGSLVVTDNVAVDDPVETRHALSLPPPPGNDHRETVCKTITDIKNGTRKKTQPTTQSSLRHQNQGQNTVSSIIGGYKSAVTRNAHLIKSTFDWQSGFHDHIIRNDQEYQCKNDYIENNPQNWREDRFFRR